MSLLGDFFRCDGCHERCSTDLWCTERPYSLCVQCCGCAVHLASQEDPGGRAVFTPQRDRLTWRGLQDSSSRARRHQ